MAYEFNSTIEARNIQLSSDGYVYFIAEKISSKFFEPSLGRYVSLSMSENIQPTAKDIVNCKNGKGYTADVCGRAAYNNA